MTTLRDRTALADLEREIGSFRSSTQLLRAQAHEFANQLHTICGLIQIGEYDEVVRYVDAVSRHRESLDLTVNRRVRDTAVAALLMAKSSLAAERRVELRISDDTSLDRLEPADSADVATVVGNLVDNAIDAAAASARAMGRGGPAPGRHHGRVVVQRLRTRDRARAGPGGLRPMGSRRRRHSLASAASDSR